MFNQADYYFKPESKTLRDLLKGSSYSIPDYQRAFAWSEKGGEFNTLWNDIIITEKKNFSGGFDIVDQKIQKPHFIGAIVTETQQDFYNNFEDVIDGQQRLITLTIMLSVLCDFIEKMNDVAKRQGFLNLIQSLIKDQGGSGVSISNFIPRIKLNQEQEFFLKYVLNPMNEQTRTTLLTTVTNSNRIQDRIIGCIKFFSYKMNSHFNLSTTHEYDARVERFTNTLLALVMFLKINVVKSGLAYTIFETLNTRGLDLSQGDLIKNEIYRRSQPGANRQQVMEYWKSMLLQLPDNDYAATSYIRHLFISLEDDVKASEIFMTISEYLEKHSVSDYALMLRDEANAYSVISGDSSSGDMKTDELLEEITNILKVTASYPLLIAGAKVFGIGSLAFRSLVKVTRDFCFRYFTIGNESVAKIEQIMGSVSRKLRKNGEILSIISEFKIHSPDQIFIDDFKIYQAKQPVVAFYIIRQIEIFLSNNSGVVPFSQSPQQHLEHIMPKKPVSIDWGHVINDERYNTFVHRVGNLLVLEGNINKSIKNKSFKYKVGGIASGNLSYLDSSLKLPLLTGSYLHNDQWDFRSIEDRQNDLADVAVKIWSFHE